MHISAMRNLHAESKDFMSLFISYFDGEKDPRNLMVVFSILQVPMSEWGIEENAKELFDAVFNYFPITFKPPPDDPYGITAQQLKDRLRECIAATGSFAPYAFPELLDKLDSTSLNTKRDSLQAITACVKNYGPRVVKTYSITLWDALKYEILSVQEEDLAELALLSLAEIASQLAQGPSAGLQEYLKPICRECNEHLEDAPTKQSNASGRILQAIAQGAPAACNFIMNAVLPNLFTLYQSADNMPKRRGLTEVLVKLLHANINIYGDWRNFDPQTQAVSGNILSTFSDQISEVLSNSLVNTPQKEVSFRLVTVDGILQLTKVRNILPDGEISKIVKILQDIVLSEESFGADEVKSAAMNALVEIAKQKPQLVNDTAFSAFMAKLPDTDLDSKEYIAVLEAFAKFGSVEEIFNTVLVRLRYKLNAAVRQGATSAYIQAMLSAMLYAISNGAPNLTGTHDTCPYYEDFVLPLLTQALALPSKSNTSLFQDNITLDLVGRISNQILRAQTAEFQVKKAKQFIDEYWGQSTAQQGSAWQNHIIIITWLLASLRREAPPTNEPLSYISKAISLIRQPTLSPQARSSTLSQVSLTINKYVSHQDLKAIFGTYFTGDENLLSPSNICIQNIRIAFSITKALVLRNAAVLSSLLPALLDFLKDDTHGKTIARGFSTLLAPDDVLTKQNHCTIAGLHKQKVFSLLVPAMTSSFRSAESAQAKTNYLIALSGLLKWLPYGIIESEVPTLIPLLLQSLDIDGEDEVRASTVLSLTSILQQTPKPLEEHVGSLVGRLLKLATPRKEAPASGTAAAAAQSAPPRVRVLALQCLALAPAQLRTEIILPFRRQIIKMLAGALDDGRRAVRAEAVRCRAKWTAVDEAGEDDED